MLQMGQMDLMNSVWFHCCDKIFVKNSFKLNSGSLLKVQQCGNEILESTISFIYSFKACRGMEY